MQSRPSTCDSAKTSLTKNGAVTIPLVKGRFQNLDGARAIAVAVVIVSHLFFGKSEHGAARVVRALAGDGELGVSIFFVISGFLITSLLRKEARASGTISIGGFYRRRVRRIFPALYFYLAVVAALALAHVMPVSIPGFAAAAFFVRDYVFASRFGWSVGHLWSLGVEEQFYLIWPFLVWKLTPRRALQVTVAIIVVEPLIRLATYYVAPGQRDYISLMFHTRVDMLMFGCALSLLAEMPEAAALFARTRTAPVVVLAAAVVFVITPIGDQYLRGRYMFSVGYTLTGLSIAVLLAYVMAAEPEVIVTRVLSHPIVARVGVISYSLYLWQQICLTPDNPVLRRFFPLGVVLAFVMAEFSHRFVEKPFLTYRQRSELGDGATALEPRQETGA